MITPQQSIYLDAMGIQVWRERHQKAQDTSAVPANAIAVYNQQQVLIGLVQYDPLPTNIQHAAMRLLDNILFSQGWQRGDMPSGLSDSLLMLTFGAEGVFPSLADLLKHPLQKRDVMNTLMELNND